MAVLLGLHFQFSRGLSLVGGAARQAQMKTVKKTLSALLS